MTVRQPMLVATAVVAFTGGLPRAGDEVILSASGLLIPGRFRAVTPQLAPENCASGFEPKPHWSLMASIEIEYAPVLPAGQKSQAIVLLDPDSQQPIASGVTIACAGQSATAQSRLSSGLIIWLTGLSGAGKTTLARALEPTLGIFYRVEVLDGDMVRTHICNGLGFTEEDRRENVRRLAYLAKLIADTDAVAVVSAISPYRTMREEARRMADRFLEVYVNAPLSVCEERDVKGLYKKARKGELRSFTGIDDPYEAPIDAEVECRTDLETVAESVAKIQAAVLAFGSNVREDEAAKGT